MIYVCSDIHGQYDRYIKMMDIIKPTDTLYILGDVIDRHSGSIEILKDIMQHKNIIFLIGNHEDMFYKTIFEKDKFWNDVWFSNKGIGTYKKYVAETKNDPDFPDKIKKYFEESYIQKRITVNNKKYCLCHAAPYDPTSDTILYKNATEMMKQKILWETPIVHNRIFTDYKLQLDWDETAIVGHRPVQILGTTEAYRLDDLIDIDGGCAMPKAYKNNNLILMNISKEEFIYIE